MSNTALNRSTVLVLTNKSGGSVAQGDVVVLDTANASAFTTTTSAGYSTTPIGVVLEPNGIANDASGLVSFGGYVPKVNLSGAASLGDYFKTHTVAKQAVRHGAPTVEGDFGTVLATGTTPAAMLSNKVQPAAGASGAPTTAKYVTSAADGTLSAEVVIPGMAANADIAGAGGAGTAEEFDGADPLTWDNAPNAVDCNSTIKSHEYIKITASNTYTGTKDWAPGAGAIDARAKISMGGDANTGQHQIGLYIGNSDASTYVQCHITIKSGAAAPTNNSQVRAYKHASSSDTQIGSDQVVNGLNTVYARITRDAGTNWYYYYSTDGILWHYIGTTAQALTIAKLGFFIYTSDSVVYYFAADWLRTSA